MYVSAESEGGEGAVGRGSRVDSAGGWISARDGRGREVLRAGVGADSAGTDL